MRILIGNQRYVKHATLSVLMVALHVTADMFHVQDKIRKTKIKILVTWFTVLMVVLLITADMFHVKISILTQKIMTRPPNRKK